MVVLLVMAVKGKPMICCPCGEGCTAEVQATSYTLMDTDFLNLIPSTSTENHPDVDFSSVGLIMILILEENNEIPPELLPPLLDTVRTGNKPDQWFASFKHRWYLAVQISKKMRKILLKVARHERILQFTPLPLKAVAVLSQQRKVFRAQYGD
ncbi:hypothetical protein DKX38_028423 [Salix brachista]|uniref:Uncharacterized protein n=1 Tax=Salix brachista TaxID=2182728 RepID=A0A5N5JHB6_9ROSI|nr:hypothetical protein DKX38_028423 [Salix brachista]